MSDPSDALTAASACMDISGNWTDLAGTLAAATKDYNTACNATEAALAAQGLPIPCNQTNPRLWNSYFDRCATKGITPDATLNQHAVYAWMQANP